MKITLSFKTPSIADDAVDEEQEIVRNRYLLDHDVEDKGELTEEEREELKDLLAACKDEVEEICDKFLTYGEYVEIELDTVTQEARVVPVKH